MNFFIFLSLSLIQSIRVLISIHIRSRYETISISATKQLALADLLAKLISEWDDVLFLTIPYKDSGVNILTQLDDTQMLLEDQIIKVEAMRGSAFVKLIEEEVKTFYFLLHRIQSTIEEWTKVFLEALSCHSSFLSFLYIHFIPIYSCIYIYI